MRFYIILSLSTLLLICYKVQTLAQVAPDCIQKAPLVREGTTNYNLSLDSMYNALKGEWYLVEKRSGWSKPSSLSGSIKLVLYNKGAAEVKESEKEVSTFTIKVSIRFGYYRFILHEFTGKKIISLTHNNPGKISICGSTLILSNNRGDGETLIFKRKNA